jgi:pimeloyl-ACP methyl ester carboxylesterase
MASPSVNVTNKNDIIFKIDKNLILTDAFNIISPTPVELTLQINFNEGTGWHSLVYNVDNYIPIHFDSAKTYLIETRVMGTGANPLSYSKSTLTTKRKRAGSLDTASTFFTIYGLNINVYNPCAGTSDSVTKNLIYLEGFDVMDFRGALNRDADLIYKEQIYDTKIADLRNYGYKIWVVDWVNSRQKIQNNADNLIKLINYINCKSALGDINNKEEIVIMGESMGGLVARYALMKMEQQTLGTCKLPQKHNVRLLMTLDSPHEGAHIPMSMQHLYRYLRNHIPFINVANLGMKLAVKELFNYYDLFLDGDAAKQMLQYHVSTQSLLGPSTYQMHNLRKTFLDEMNALGTNPRYCKIVALSNGNMRGIGQTRYWDGQPRVAGDRLLELHTRAYVRILGQQFNLAGGDVVMNTDPNGIGNLGSLNYGTWWFKIRLKWWGLRVKTGFYSLAGKIWDGDMRPISTSAGGLMDFNYVVENALLSRPNMSYAGSGNWPVNNPNKIGVSTSVNTDGFHWSFIPTNSGLMTGPTMNIAYDNVTPSNLINNILRFDVNIGIPGNQQKNPPQFAQYNFKYNSEIWNRYHLNMRNDTLQNNGVYLFHPSSIYNNVSYQRPSYMLNREIGNDSIVLENRTLPWESTLSINLKISVNKRSLYYTYPSISNPLFSRPSVWSKENPYTITQTGKANLRTNPVQNINYVAPYSGIYTQSTYSALPCISNYYIGFKQLPNNNAVDNINTNTMELFPNPTFTKQVVLQFIPVEMGILDIKLYDLQVKQVYQVFKEINSLNMKYIIPLQLPTYLNTGLYIVSSRLNNKTFINKLNIQ